MLVAVEWFAIVFADFESVKRCTRFDKADKIRFADKRLRFDTIRIIELCFESPHSFHFGFVCIGNIDNNGRIECIRLHVIVETVRTVSFLSGIFIESFYFLQARIEQRPLYNFTDGNVIGMPVVFIRSKNQFGFIPADWDDRLESVFFVNQNIAVRYVEVIT